MVHCTEACSSTFVLAGYALRESSRPPVESH